MRTGRSARFLAMTSPGQVPILQIVPSAPSMARAACSAAATAAAIASSSSACSLVMPLTRSLSLAERRAGQGVVFSGGVVGGHNSRADRVHIVFERPLERTDAIR